jgi:hypothetical protein
MKGPFITPGAMKGSFVASGANEMTELCSVTTPSASAAAEPTSVPGLGQGLAVDDLRRHLFHAR